MCRDNRELFTFYSSPIFNFSSLKKVFSMCVCSIPFPSPGALPDPGIEPRSPALLADTLLSEPPVKSYSPKRYTGSPAS